MKLIDTHVDTLTTLIDKKEDLFSNSCHISIEKLKEFENSAIFFAIWLDVNRRKNPFHSTMEVIDFYYSQIDKNKESIAHSNNYEDIINNWNNNKISSLLTLEGSEALDGNLDNLYKFYEKGVRSLTITWNNSNISGHGALSKCDDGLTDFGKEVIKICNDLNILVDVSHINKKGFFDIIDKTTKPIIATHSNSYTICQHNRNLTDDQIREIKNVDGIVGLTYHSPFVSDLLEYEEEVFLRHIDYILNLMGEDKVCLGSDFDGTNFLPCRIADVTYNISLYYFLEKAYNNTIANKIFYENQLSFIKKNL